MSCETVQAKACTQPGYFQKSKVYFFISSFKTRKLQQTMLLLLHLLQLRGNPHCAAQGIVYFTVYAIPGLNFHSQISQESKEENPKWERCQQTPNTNIIMSGKQKIPLATWFYLGNCCKLYTYTKMHQPQGTISCIHTGKFAGITPRNF